MPSDPAFAPRFAGALCHPVEPELEAELVGGVYVEPLVELLGLIRDRRGLHAELTGDEGLALAQSESNATLTCSKISL